jgi:hypothetical protein
LKICKDCIKNIVEYDIDVAILAEAVKRKDSVIDALLDVVRKIK